MGINKFNDFFMKIKTINDFLMEIKKNQSMEVDKLQGSHKKTINNARKKYIKEKMKWQVI